ncbi:MAG: ABC transporter permease [Bacteroidota bacterium]|nr:ABC transporter permease [Bacteroidota bacterium]
MGKIGLIIQKEYLRRVNKKSFIIFTFLTPLLIVLLVAMPLWLSTFKDTEVKNIALIDVTGKYGAVLKDRDNYHFINMKKEVGTFNPNDHKDIYAFVMIDADLLQHPDKITIYSETQITTDLKGYISDQLSKYLSNEKLASYNIPDLKKIIQDSQIELNIKTIKRNDNGKEKAASSEFATAVGLVATFMIYMFIFMYGAMVMRGVMEEKSSRIVEVLVSSVKPIELMLGKIIGIALVGLTQFLLWVILSLGILMVVALTTGMPLLATASAQAPGILQMMGGVNLAEIILYFVLYFLGGYLLYASLFAAVGSAVDSETDTQQFMLPITIPIIFAMYAGIYSAQNPDGPLAFWCSLIPFTSPIVMMVRLPFDVPLWEKLLSLTLLIITFIGTTWMAAKIYRTGILMYGKKVNYRELLKWLKY